MTTSDFINSGTATISIVVPVYNAAKYLREALESASSQTFENYEVIVVNDGSTDESEEICREFCDADSRFRLITQKNRGLSAARNAGTQIATGEWVTYLDADDMLVPDSLERLMEASVSSGQKIVVGRFSHDMQRHLGRNAKANVTSLSSDCAIKLGLYQKKNISQACGVLYHNSIFKGANSLSFRKCYYEDLDFFYRAFESVGKVCILDNIVYLYRDNPSSFLHKWSNSRLDVLDVTDRIVNHMKNRGEELHRAALDRRFSAHFNILLLMLKTGVDLPEQKARCLRVIREQRLNELKDQNVRLKNKLGALASYLGTPILKLMSNMA